MIFTLASTLRLRKAKHSATHAPYGDDSLTSVKTRTLTSFLDLALIMVGVMGLMLKIQNPASPALAAVQDRFGEQQQMQEYDFALDEFFAPNDARLSAKGKEILAASITKTDGIKKAIIYIPMDKIAGNERLNQWELSAARTSIVMQYLKQQGMKENAITADMNHDDKNATNSNAMGKSQMHIVIIR